MEEKVTDLVYAVRQLCEALREADLVEKDEDVKDCLTEVESLLEEMTEFENEEDI